MYVAQYRGPGFNLQDHKNQNKKYHGEPLDGGEALIPLNVCYASYSRKERGRRGMRCRGDVVLCPWEAGTVFPGRSGVWEVAPRQREAGKGNLWQEACRLVSRSVWWEQSQEPAAFPGSISRGQRAGRFWGWKASLNFRCGQSRCLSVPLQ